MHAACATPASPVRRVTRLAEFSGAPCASRSPSPLIAAWAGQEPARGRETAD